jgi:FGGY-family pentulose kinase
MDLEKNKRMKDTYFIGCDVGTGSVRVGLFNQKGSLILTKKHPIKLWRPENDFVQQSSDDIWNACITCFKALVKDSEVPASQIKGIGFDATCSLVVLGEDDRPLPIGHDNSDYQNIIVWMDHRAIREAMEINQTGHEVLNYVGGKVSPEMQIPKLLWLKRNKPDIWNRAKKFMDLPDYLVYRATGDDVRSICTTTCKWTYASHKAIDGDSSMGWDDSFFKIIGLEDLTLKEYSQIGKKVRPVGESVGNGLSKKAAREFGLEANTPVGVAIIDAHAGGLGLLGMDIGNHEMPLKKLESRIALIGGTSSCHMATSRKPQFIGGIWGPYYSAMLPGVWLNEGGQSATGSLIDHVIFTSDQSEILNKKAISSNKSVYQVLNDYLEELAKKRGLSSKGLLTEKIHVLPYFHGNRSPRANPNLVGMVSGLKLSSTLDDLALLYLSTVQAIAYGTRHIIEELNRKGYTIDTIMATGGGAKNDVFLQEHANITGCKIILPAETEAVLLGSAILGAVASGTYASVFEAMAKMNRSGNIIHPQSGEIEIYHNKKYNVFLKMYDDQITYNNLMHSSM